MSRPSGRGGWRRRDALAAALLALAWPLARAEDLPGLIARVKSSVLLVGSYGVLDSPRFGFRGTGFVVADGRHALTNAHVLPSEQTPAGRVERSVVVQAFGSDGQWRMREASVVAVDNIHDIALLRFEGPPLTPLPLRQDKTAAPEGTPIALMGFPLGGALGFSHVTHAGIVSAVTSVALPAANSQALNARAVAQLRQGSFEVLQLDATAYPGNSGGPVFDLATGQVIGVVSMVVIKGTKESALSMPSGISYAIPILQALPMLPPGP